MTSSWTSDFHHLEKAEFSSLLLCKAVFPFPHTPLWKQVTTSSPSSMGEGGVKLHLLEGAVSTDILWNSTERKFSLLLTFKKIWRYLVQFLVWTECHRCVYPCSSLLRVTVNPGNSTRGDQRRSLKGRFIGLGPRTGGTAQQQTALCPPPRARQKATQAWLFLNYNVAPKSSPGTLFLSWYSKSPFNNTGWTQCLGSTDSGSLGSFFVLKSLRLPSLTQRHLDSWRMPSPTSTQGHLFIPTSPRLSFPTKKHRLAWTGDSLALRSEATKSAVTTYSS